MQYLEQVTELAYFIVWAKSIIASLAVSFLCKILMNAKTRCDAPGERSAKTSLVASIVVAQLAIT